MRVRSSLVAMLLVTAAAGFAQQGPIKVEEEKPGMLKSATISAEAAIKAARAVVPNAKIQSAEIERENGKVVYSFDMKVAGRSYVDEVQIDAKTGAVVAHKHETPATEKAEKRAEKAKKKN